MKPGPKPRPIAERFWEKVDKNGPVPGHRPELGPCWVWTAGTAFFDYGAFQVERGIQGLPKRRPLGAHCVAFWLTFGRWPLPECCHHCDNPPCVNPAHLFEATHAENMRDKSAKGHGGTKTPLSGEANPAAKLTRKDVAEIRDSLAAGRSKRALALVYEVSRATIYRIANDEGWR